ncbi:O-antigen ligase family protein [Pseudotamlana carrageenivorans]|uniref:O-antigen ligase-related domain-containing protein n=1 Tax=Pseudotamlana carrageenivorans TaxID=2069432 RepID=A0A2I7SH34_9FLAO|nr:O-antigen ligase family protein [Tamlana carrageenivorans]AUS05217.1 hypothetical protein C1A40_06915 [Tamlana carrageenivorans]
MIDVKSISNFFGKFSIVLILIALNFSYLVEGLVGFTGFRNIVLLIGLGVFFIKILLYPKLDISKPFFVYVLLGLSIAFISVFFWLSLGEINVYFTLITTTIVLSCGVKFLKKALLGLVLIILVLAIYEFFTKTYVFAVYRDTQWGIKALDPTFYGGNWGLFRAKALFEGPLALAQFAIGLALLYRKNLKILVLSIVLAMLSNGRLAMIVCALALIFSLTEKYNIIKFFLSKKGLIIVFFILMGCVFALNYFVTGASLERLKGALDFSDPSNQGRFYYWTEGISMYFDYNLVHLLFGNSGYFRSVIGNSAENGWLMLLLDNGLFGFLFYFLPPVYITYLSLRFKTGHYMFVGLIFICMMIQTFHLGALASLFYWLIIYFYLIDFKIIRDEKNYTNTLS